MTIVTEYDFETNTLTPHDARQVFRTLVARVAARAKERLPQAVNGRIEKAVTLVLADDVEPQADGSILVGSSSDALKQYRLEGHSCECQDFTRGQAPDGWCQHRIAAGIAKRVQEIVPQSPGGETEPIPSAPASPAVPAALPEAPASVNVRLQIAGRDVQLTLRDFDEARLLVRLEEVLQRFPLPPPAPPAATQGQLSPQQHNAAAMHRPVRDFCPVHNVQMQENEKEGRRWFSHRTADGHWCKGK